MEPLGDLRRDDSDPLYLRLARMIGLAIAERRLRAGVALPSERDLCRSYGLSRVTVRKALAKLIKDGILVSRHGAGTFVVEAEIPIRIDKSFSALTSFSEEMASRGLAPSSVWLGRATASVNPTEALALALSPGQSVHRFRRVRLADGAPMAIEISAIAGFALPSPETVDASLYDALDVEGFRPVRALQRLSAMAFDGARAHLLGVQPGAAGLLIERRAFLADGRAVEFTSSYYRGDAYDVVAEMGA